MLQTLSIRTKIMLLVGVLLSGIVLLSIVGVLGLNRVRTSATDLHDKGFGPAEQTLLLHKHLYKLRGDIYKLLLLPEESEKIRGDIGKDQAKIDSTLDNLSARATVAPDSIKAAIASTTAAIGDYRKAVEEISEKAKSGDSEFGKTSMKNGAAHLARKNVDAQAGTLLDLVDAEVGFADHRATSTGHLVFVFMLCSSVILLVFGSVASFALARQILTPLEHMVSALDKIGHGDFRDDSATPTGTGEIAQMARSLQGARDQLRKAFAAVGTSSSHAMDSATSQLEMTRKLTTEADANEREAHSAASATEKASITLKTIANGASTSMGSLESVSAAIEEMSASVSEIARSADQTRAMTHKALDGARSASHRMTELATASKEIETVIEMIVEISEQTKLLALNATIEAARAGEAGRGFAVVAGEVKELAKGTADATEDIRKRVEAIRSSTSNAVQEIATVTGNMETLGQNISSIAGAVEQQSATTREISRNIGEAVQGTREIHRNLDAGSQAVGEISRDIQNVLARGKVLREISVQASGLSERSAELSRELAAQVGKFKV